jgi:hypothetical protein
VSTQRMSSSLRGVEGCQYESPVDPSEESTIQVEYFSKIHQVALLGYPHQKFLWCSGMTA